MEGFGEVIIGAQRQAGDAVFGCAGRGEHQHHRRLVRIDDHPAQRVAVDSREVAIQDDDVVRVEVKLRRGLVTIVGDVNRDPLVT